MDNDPSAKCMISGNSFLHQLLKLSKSGRNYTEEEIRDHIGTMLVAVSFRFLFVFMLSFDVEKWIFTLESLTKETRFCFEHQQELL